jgi:hypothetical protein
VRNRSWTRSLARQLGRLGTVQRATVYRAIMVAPPTGYAKQQATHVARYDVVVLLETTSPEVLGEVQATQPCKLLVEAVTEAATDVHVMTARCPKRVGDVDKTRQGLFLFNYFVADDSSVALQLWDYLAGWYAVETGLGNSTLLEPLGDADYVFVNHARWDHSLPRFMLRQLTRPSFRSYLLANLQANRTGGNAHPLPARLTAYQQPQARVNTEGGHTNAKAGWDQALQRLADRVRRRGGRTTTDDHSTHAQQPPPTPTPTSSTWISRSTGRGSRASRSSATNGNSAASPARTYGRASTTARQHPRLCV